MIVRRKIHSVFGRLVSSGKWSNMMRNGQVGYSGYEGVQRRIGRLFSESLEGNYLNEEAGPSEPVRKATFRSTFKKVLSITRLQNDELDVKNCVRLFFRSLKLAENNQDVDEVRSFLKSQEYENFKRLLLDEFFTWKEGGRFYH